MIDHNSLDWLGVTAPHRSVVRTERIPVPGTTATRCRHRGLLSLSGRCDLPCGALGIADSFGLAFYKAQDAAQARLPLEGAALLTIADQDKGPEIIAVARGLGGLGFKLKTTIGTQAFLAEHGIESERLYKMQERWLHITGAIKDGEIQLVIDTPRGKASQADDSYTRKAAIRHKVPYLTTVVAASATAKGIAAFREGAPVVKPLQDYHRGIQ